MPPFSTAAAMQKLSPARRRAAERRLRDLESEIVRTGGRLRDDSRLSYRYAINDTTEPYMSAADVAHELACVDRLHTETAYAESVQISARTRAAELNANGVHWHAAWDIVKTHHFDAEKYKFMLETGLRF